jgi:hypothetical protein
MVAEEAQVHVILLEAEGEMAHGERRRREKD